ncbi:MAG: head maturation protease, ClpP-related [Cognatishimia sp.]
MNGTDLIMNGTIVLEGYIHSHEYCELYGGGCFSARMVREALAAFSGDAAIVINSQGGDPFEGESARAAMEAHPGKVTLKVNGVAASAASLLAMGADVIEMSAGSFLMIHNPSSGLFGSAEEHEAEAGRLRLLADTYAGVYAARAGKTVEEMHALMAEETYFGAAAAVEVGLADQVTGNAASDVPEAEAIEAVKAEMSAYRKQYLMKINEFKSPGTSPGGNPTAPASQPQASMAATQEPNHMSKGKKPAVQTPQPAAATVAEPDATMTSAQTETVMQQGITAERERQRAIREVAAPFMAAGTLPAAEVENVINAGTAAEAAGNRFMAIMAASAPSTVPAVVSGAHQDETDTRVEGMICAMMGDFSGSGSEFRGMRIRDLAVELGGRKGFDRMAQVQRGMQSTAMMGGAHGVSDFAYITTEVMNRRLLDAYERRVANWQRLAGTPMQASDFRELHAVRFGGDFQLKTVKENGEYEEATLKDEAEGLKVERRGRTINITFEAVVNDDMGAFDRIPREFAIAARQMEASMVWALIRENAVLKSDDVALFHASHGNLGTAAGITVDSVGKARKRMWEQKAYGAAEKSEDFLMIEPDLLIVPPALETAAGKFTAEFTPAKTTDANPYRATLEPIVAPHLGAVAGGSDTAWYVASSDMPPISVAHLEGHAAPTVRTIEGMNPDKVTMNARHIFGAAATEFRGIDKNPGS